MKYNSEFKTEVVSPDRLKKMLTKYFSERLMQDVTINILLSINNGNCEVNFYCECDNMSYLISKDIINTILEAYITDKNGIFDYAQYVTGVRLKDNNPKLAADMPIFDGIYLYYYKPTKHRKSI